MSLPTEYALEVLPHDDDSIHRRLFSSESITDVVAAVTWMIDLLPTEMQRADARVRIMLLLRHPEEATP